MGLDLRVVSRLYRRWCDDLPHIAAGRVPRHPAATLRFYETTGLLPAERTASGYRGNGDRGGFCPGRVCAGD
ncbi:MerR family DNA-binding transcriptional regulator [Streptomyces avermitilis]|uniref:MerR family DNA-binding transcriptional regulator n=1 Tax=Streptomyces avermitilis TaxID=33903 RepID=UPI0033BA8688